MSEKVTRQDLIAEFNRLADELGKKPTLGEFEDGKYSSTPVYKRFENYGELKEAAGYESGEKRIDDKTLLNDLQRVADELGRSPPVMKYDEHGNHNSKTLKNRFGNWSKVLETAGLEDTGHAKHWRDNEPEQFDKDYGTVTVECEYCGDTKQTSPYAARNRSRFFCGHDCKGSFMSTQTGEDARCWDGGKVEIVCEWCGDTKDVKPAEVDNARFCEQDCMIEWRSKEFSGENHPRWVDNPKYRYYGPNWEDQAEKARERDGYQCQLCDRTNQDSLEKWDEKLSVHHMIRFYDFDHYTVANQLPNLVTVCKEHHTVLDLELDQPPEEHVERLNAWLESLDASDKPE